MTTEKLQVRISELENSLSNANSTIEDVTQENEACRSMCEKLQNEKNQEMEQKIAELTEAADTHKAKYNQIKQAYYKFRNEHVEKLKAFSALQKELEEKEATNVALQSEMEKSEGSLAGLQSEFAAKTAAYADLQTSLSQLRKEYEDLQRDHSQLNADYQQLTMVKDANTEALAKSEAKVASISTDLSEAQTQLQVIFFFSVESSIFIKLFHRRVHLRFKTKLFTLTEYIVLFKC
ncbi:unnamed protein product [Soboliphyme baturini]|uniref:TACC_C domain-containing protein n=1 Tax=Soboliphyme baturini TaxID=241478 RepID=A0A183J9M1_9BILA|nr:unnamed protein product [Soboliphyme baturini]